MANAAKILSLIAAFLVVHTVPRRLIIWRQTPSRARPYLPAPEPDTTPPALDGAQLFATHCAMCHKPEELARPLQDAADPDGASANMAAFLAPHGRCDAAADMAVIDYLAHSKTLMR
jgi:mono/diheme cytochrome c family protein